MHKKGFFHNKDNSYLRLAEVATDVPDLLGKMTTVKESSMARLGSALQDHGRYFAKLMDRKKELAARTFYKGGKLLAALIIGPAKMMRPDPNVGRIARQFFGDAAAAGDNADEVNHTTDRANPINGFNPAHNTSQANYNRVLTAFGGYRIKTTITQSIVVTLEWLDNEIKKHVGMHIPEEVVDKIKKPGLGPSVDNAVGGNPAYDLGIAGL